MGTTSSFKWIYWRLCIFIWLYIYLFMTRYILVYLWLLIFYVTYSFYNSLKVLENRYMLFWWKAKMIVLPDLITYLLPHTSDLRKICDMFLPNNTSIHLIYSNVSFHYHSKALLCSTIYQLSMLLILILTFIHSEFNVFLSGNKLIPSFVENNGIQGSFMQI